MRLSHERLRTERELWQERLFLLYQKDTAENVVRELKSRKGGQEKLGTNKKWKNVNEIKKRGQVTVWIP